MTLKTKPRLVGLDVARIFAALAVMVFHLAYWSGFKASTPGSVLQEAVLFPELAPFVFWGRFGVEIFFVISGFVIAFSAANATPWHFIRARFLRLVPAAFICATMTFAVAVMIGWLPMPALVERYIRTLTFNFYGPWIDGVYWTLGIEVSFYIFVAALLAIRRFSWVEPAMAIIGITSATFWIWAWAASHGYVHPLAFPIQGRARDLTFTFGTYFAAGVFLWSSLMIRPTIVRSAALSIFVIGGMVGIYMTAPASYHNDPSLRWVPVGIWVAAIALMATSVRFDALLSARIGERTLAWIRLCGTATYPLYLLHDIIGAAILRAIALQGVERYTALICTFAIVIALSIAITLALEPPLRKSIARIIDFRPLRPKAIA
ncbi:acyltransferase [Mesorhizobium sp. B2-5-3]|uniref:acyltransferase family protein n=1 Tax=Mesorhizobium sp. B2-5-3 TaxID=2589927 RepID=UPI00112BB82B|nr:acyltransferase [Mesorhizobium sp. B2-5-3]TPK38711.1 acyltransferase [Mesorhizobium sp. B2-5-3]